MKQPAITLDDGAKDVSLAEMLFNLLHQNLEQKSQKLSSFEALNSNKVGLPVIVNSQAIFLLKTFR